ncbi:MAG: hypothetical protein WCB95_08570, partial [Aeromicrobium sp.]
MSDSTSSNSSGSRRFDPLQAAADTIRDDGSATPSGPAEKARRGSTSDPLARAAKAFDEEHPSDTSHDDGKSAAADKVDDQADDGEQTPRERRAAARAARKEAMERRRKERLAAKASVAKRRHAAEPDDESVPEKSLSDKLAEARRGAASAEASAGSDTADTVEATEGIQETESSDDALAQETPAHADATERTPASFPSLGVMTAGQFSSLVSGAVEGEVSDP